MITFQRIFHPVIVSVCLSVHTPGTPLLDGGGGGGGTPIWGTTSQVRMGVPQNGVLSLLEMGYNQPEYPTGQGWGTPQPGKDGGVPQDGLPSWPGMGYPPARVGVLPSPPPGMGHSPGIGQQVEYLIHGGRYASCVHAGELSCLFFGSCVEILTKQQILMIFSVNKQR